MRYTPSSVTDKPISVSIAPERGSNMFKFAYGEHVIIYTEPELLKNCGFTGNFVLFPTPNRVKNSTYTWHGKTITQKKNGELRPLHGLVYDEKWQYEEPVLVALVVVRFGKVLIAVVEVEVKFGAVKRL